MADLTDRAAEIALRWQRRGQTEALAPTLNRAYPVDDASCFDDSLKAIDEAEIQVWGCSDPTK